MLLRTIAFSGASVLLATSAFAQSGADTAYCKSLSGAYRDYARGGVVDGEIATAMSQCDSNPNSSIPVLEKILTGNKIKLPARS
ncbi:hypothetical protein SAMN02745126_06098 [Enhydrobacter aerosaccus]|uniref:TrbM protein n=1 Tax=Enhydrobacter aerosaccus TaxID=225324 RepID=A0A1T4TE78_9HYPH|nr:hypothetical protein [Enhydrobacter aerosaccus]SKA38762.1 hypothetical protein SAMN02745126_06098 [Enhydrobacter aerosaccus]